MTKLDDMIEEIQSLKAQLAAEREKRATEHRARRQVEQALNESLQREMEMGKALEKAEAELVLVKTLHNRAVDERDAAANRAERAEVACAQMALTTSNGVPALLSALEKADELAAACPEADLTCINQLSDKYRKLRGAK